MYRNFVTLQWSLTCPNPTLPLDMQQVCARPNVLGVQVAIPGGGTTTIKAYLRDTYSYELEFIGPVVAILVGFSCFFIVMAVVVLRTINFQKR